jgi:hypothetical protein
MPSSGILHRVALVRTDVSEEHIASIIRVTRIGELGTLAVTSKANVVPTLSILVTLMMEAILSSETSVLTRATRCKVPEDEILLSISCIRSPQNVGSWSQIPLQTVTCVSVLSCL